MAFGIRVSEAGFDVNTTPTSTNKKDFVFLSDENSPKVYFSGFLEEASSGAGISYSHGLSKVPMFFMFSTDSKTTPTYFTATADASATTTTIDTTLALVYLIILNEGT